jgi:hypothetical protein
MLGDPRDDRLKLGEPCEEGLIHGARSIPPERRCARRASAGCGRDQRSSTATNLLMPLRSIVTP